MEREEGKQYGRYKIEREQENRETILRRYATLININFISSKNISRGKKVIARTVYKKYQKTKNNPRKRN